MWLKTTRVLSGRMVLLMNSKKRDQNIGPFKQVVGILEVVEELLEKLESEKGLADVQRLGVLQSAVKSKQAIEERLKKIPSFQRDEYGELVDEIMERVVGLEQKIEKLLGEVDLKKAKKGLEDQVGLGEKVLGEMRKGK